MHTISKRSVDPASLEFTVTFDPVDLDLAFFEHPTEEIEDLFFALFSPGWKRLTVAEQLFALSRVAGMVEGAGQASNLNLAASPVERK